MKFALLTAWAAIVLSSACAFAQPDSQAEDPFKERLGARMGYIRAENDLSDAFGAGFDLSIHFIQRIKKPLGIDVTVGAIYLGSTDREVTITRANGGVDFSTLWFDKVRMRILRFTAAPIVEFAAGERTSCYLSAGGGLYTATLLLDQTIYQYDFSNNHFGVNAGAGIMRRIFTNWFLDLNLQLHKFWTPDQSSSLDVDWIYEFSDGDSDPWFWSVTAGAALRLF